MLAVAACSDPTPTPTATPTVVSIPSPTPTQTGALPGIPSIGVEDKFGANIRVLENGGYELFVFATPDDLANVFRVTVGLPDGTEQTLQLAEDSWHYVGTGTPPTGRYMFTIALNGDTSFQKSRDYDGEGP